MSEPNPAWGIMSIKSQESTQQPPPPEFILDTHSGVRLLNVKVYESTKKKTTKDGTSRTCLEGLWRCGGGAVKICTNSAASGQQPVAEGGGN